MGVIRVAVAGAAGRMGLEVIRAVLAENDMTLVGAVDVNGVGEDPGQRFGSPAGVTISTDLGAVLAAGVDVLVDFTSPKVVKENVRLAVRHRVATVVGTTGLSSNDLDEIGEWCAPFRTPVLVAPNFAIGAILMMHCSAIAARYFNSAEIIELHHDQKLDAPSGTAIKTAEMILAARTSSPPGRVETIEKIRGVRGGEYGGIHMHSVRLPGLIAHQEVLFGNTGQTLTIRHDSTSRESFMPGVILAVRKIRDYDGLVYGLERMLGIENP